MKNIDDGHISIDINRVEHAFKSFGHWQNKLVVVTTASDADASTMLNSIVETAKAE